MCQCYVHIYRRRRRIPSQYEHYELQPHEPMFTVANPRYSERSVYDEIFDLDNEADGDKNATYYNVEPDDVFVGPASNEYRGPDAPANDETYYVSAVPSPTKVYQQLDAPALTSIRDSELDNDNYMRPKSDYQEEPTMIPITNSVSEEASQIDDTYMYPNSESPDVQTVTPITNSVSEEAS